MELRSAFMRMALCLVMAVLLAQGAHAQVATVAERYPAGSIRSEEAADQALKDVDSERQAIEARYVVSERACFDKFFATSCMQTAKDQRRDAMAQMRAIEVEAHTFKRRMRAEDRERATAERSAKREAQASERMQTTPVPQASGDSGAE